MRRSLRGTGFKITAVLGFSLAWLAARPAFATIRYTVSVDHPDRHLFSIEMEVPEVKDSVTLQLPAWNALYQIRDFSSHLRQVSAMADGKPLPIQKLDKQSWRITGAGTVRVRYEAYWDEPGPFSTQLNAEHAFINLAMILLYVPDRRGEDVVVTLLQIPTGWKVATALPVIDAELSRNHSVVFQARSYDALVDSPVEAGKFQEFDVPGVTPRIRVVVHGDNWRPDYVRGILGPICRYELGLMRDAPFETYTFLLHFGKAAGGAGGGMEHSYSTAINVPSDEFLAGVAAHEFFHLWNVKRIRPASLEPVDYAKEQWTRALWFAEGFTSTYGAYTLLRSGIWTRERFYTDLGNQITELESRPANQWQSAEQSSLDAWLEKYALYNTPDESVSYYTKGQVLGVLLDILIRDRTNGEASLDDVFRAMNTDFAKAGKTYPDTAGVRMEVEKVAGSSFEEFFRRYVSAPAPLPYREVFALVGLELEQKATSRAALGFVAMRGPGDEYVVAQVAPGSSAAAAGLQEGDVILQWNGGEVPRRLDRWVRQQRPGEKVHVRVRREGQELSLAFALDDQPLNAWAVSEARSADARARRLREGLLEGATQSH